jgi:DNA-binding NtrC family response regulator
MKPLHQPLRCLLVEDNENDALLVLRELRSGGYDVVSERVETAEEMRAALERQPWDAIIADYCMPHFSGLAALELLQSSGLDLPFILVSGTIGEDLAVAAMKAGAHDYLMKGSLARLVPALEREMCDAVERHKRKQAAAALEESNERFETLATLAPVGIYLTDPAGRCRYANPSWLGVAGLSLQEALGDGWTSALHPEDRDLVFENWQRMVASRGHW